MWKDFFYYSKSERRAIYALSVVIALLVIALVMIPGPQINLDERISSEDSLALRKVEYEVRAKVGDERKVHALSKENKRVTLNPFDPNLADSIELLSLGLPDYVVRNIIKYRQKGGRFSSPASLSRIYGLTEEKFMELKPYIKILQPVVRKSGAAEVSLRTDSVQRNGFEKPFKYSEGTLVDANRADTNELKKIPGIGSGIAKGIVAYRTRLGGFCALEQLCEVKYFTPELLRWFKLEDTEVRRLVINKDNLEILRKHPYLNFYQAKVIVEHRRKKGPIKSLSQLALYEEFTEKDLNRLSVYISFD